MIRVMLTLSRLKEVLEYEPQSGLWTWLVAKGPVRAGDVAGSQDSAGYIQIVVDGVAYLAHRLAWFYMTGDWPPDHVDHEDTIRSNNRWGNLRLATLRQNLANAGTSKANVLGVKGVTRGNSKSLPYRARIYANGKLVCLGFFETVDEASAAYFEKAKELRGEYARAR